MTNPDGQVIGKVQNEYSGIWTLYVIDPENPYAGGGDIYKIDVSGGVGNIKVEWGSSTIDGSWGIEPPPPGYPTPATNKNNKSTKMNGDVKGKVKNNLKKGN